MTMQARLEAALDRLRALGNGDPAVEEVSDELTTILAALRERCEALEDALETCAGAIARAWLEKKP